MRKFISRRATAAVSVAGFSLVEVALALGIAAFALIAIAGLLPVGINSNQVAAEQTATLGIVTSLETDLRVTARTATVSPTLGIPIPTNPTVGYPTIDASSTATFYLDGSGGPFPAPTALDATSRYRTTVNFAVPPAGQRTATLVKITISWPAQAQSDNANGSVTTLVALDRN